MEPDRKIGRVVKVKTYQALVELTPDTSSYVKSSYGGVYSIAAVNSYVIVPIGSERIVAIVTGLDMIEEAERAVLGRPMLVLPNPRRTMWVSLIGTISQIQGDARKRFEYGIRHYPELDNPVWFATEEDLDVIFEGGKCGGLRDDQLVSIGTSPLFPRYNVWIDMDRFSGTRAVLGSTGSGKSCAVTALIRAVLDKRGEKGMPPRTSSSSTPTLSTSRHLQWVQTQARSKRFRCMRDWSSPTTEMNLQGFGCRIGS